MMMAAPAGGALPVGNGRPRPNLCGPALTSKPCSPSISGRPTFTRALPTKPPASSRRCPRSAPWRCWCAWFPWRPRQSGSGAAPECLAVGSMFYGNLIALMQKDLKRLLGFSGIAHAGYALIGFVALDGRVTPPRSTTSSAYFFMVLACLSGRLPGLAATAPTAPSTIWRAAPPLAFAGPDAVGGRVCAGRVSALSRFHGQAELAQGGLGQRPPGPGDHRRS